MSTQGESPNTTYKFGCDTEDILYKSLLPLFEHECKRSFLSGGSMQKKCYQEIMNWMSTYGAGPRDDIAKCKWALGGHHHCKDPMCILHTCVNMMNVYIECRFKKQHPDCEYVYTFAHNPTSPDDGTLGRERNLPEEHLEKLSYAIKWLKKRRSDIVERCTTLNANPNFKYKFRFM